MSNVLAIAAVTEALVNLLSAKIDAAQVMFAGVSSYAPDQLDKLTGPGINVFLYQVTPNVAYRNADLPTRAADGVTFLRKPQVALDLHYLLTFYGDNSVLEPQRLLGTAVLALHANPVLPRNKVVPVPIQPGVPNSTAPSNLEDQAELIRFTPVVFTLEELSKLWSFLFKIDYVLSTAYRASVVLIEEDDALAVTAPPALAFSLVSLPLPQPVITQIVAVSGPNAPITAGVDIALIGRNLTAGAGATTQVLIGGAATPANLLTPVRITLPLPAGLAAGPQTAQVTQPVLLGTPAVAHAGTGGASGVATFVLQPTVAAGAGQGGYAITVTPQTGPPPGLLIAVTLVPIVRQGQHVVLQLLSPAGARLFDGGVLPADSATVDFPVPTLAAGTYVLQVLVDGAQSVAILGAGGVPTAPNITI